MVSMKNTTRSPLPFSVWKHLWETATATHSLTPSCPSPEHSPSPCDPQPLLAPQTQAPPTELSEGSDVHKEVSGQVLEPLGKTPPILPAPGVKVNPGFSEGQPRPRAAGDNRKVWGRLWGVHVVSSSVLPLAASQTCPLNGALHASCFQPPVGRWEPWCN